MLIEKFKLAVEEILKRRWVGEFDLADLIIQPYGCSLVFKSTKDNYRFSPTIISNKLILAILVDNSVNARQALEKEIETAFQKYVISG